MRMSAFEECKIVDDLFEKSIEYARECKAAYIVGKVHAGERTDALFV